MNVLKKQFLKALTILIACLLIATFLINQKELPPKSELVPLEAVVETTSLVSEELPLTIVGYGSVQPRRQVSIIPEVSGRIEKINPILRTGALIQQGDFLAQIDPTNYQTEVLEAQRRLKTAQRSFSEIEAQAAIAQSDWKSARLEDSHLSSPSDLALYKPQLAEAQAEIDASEQALKQAQRNLQRTTLEAPFTARIIEESLDEGQVVTAGQSYGELIDANAAEIQVTLSPRETRWLRGRIKKIQVTSAIESPSSAKIWQGTLIHELASVDLQSRLTTFVVDVSNPFGGSEELKINDYVRVIFTTTPLPHIFKIKRHAILNGHIWIVDEQSQLQPLPIEVVHSEKDFSLVTGNLKTGLRVVTSPLVSPVAGQNIRLFEENQ